MNIKFKVSVCWQKRRPIVCEKTYGTRRTSESFGSRVAVDLGRAPCFGFFLGSWVFALFFPVSKFSGLSRAVDRSAGLPAPGSGRAYITVYCGARDKRGARVPAGFDRGMAKIRVSRCLRAACAQHAARSGKCTKSPSAAIAVGPPDLGRGPRRALKTAFGSNRT